LTVPVKRRREVHPLNTAPVALFTEAAILAATASILASVRLLSLGYKLALIANDFFSAIFVLKRLLFRTAVHATARNPCESLYRAVGISLILVVSVE
jgi:hypothetical protein